MGAEEVAQWLKEYAALAEDPSPVTLGTAHNCL